MRASSKIILFATLYMCLALIHTAGMIATENEKCHHLYRNICDQYFVRTSYGIAFLYGFIPTGWPTIWMATGLWADGISFHMTPAFKVI